MDLGRSNSRVDARAFPVKSGFYFDAAYRMLVVFSCDEKGSAQVQTRVVCEVHGTSRAPGSFASAPITGKIKVKAVPLSLVVFLLRRGILPWCLARIPVVTQRPKPVPSALFAGKNGP